MPKSTRYRGTNKVLRQFNQMHPNFQAVDDAWDLAAHPTGVLVARHPRSPTEPWTHTLTYQYSITVGTRIWNLRGHVHFDQVSPGTYTSGPGYYWVSGIPNNDAKTPAGIVLKFSTWDPEVTLAAQLAAAATVGTP